MNFIYSITIFLASISLCGAVVYRFFKLDAFGVSISLILAFGLFLFLLFKLKKYSDKQYKIRVPKMIKEQKKLLKPNYSLIVPYFLLIIFCFFVLIKSQTVDSIISPWQIIPNYFFIAYFLAGLNLLIIILKKSKLTIPAISLFYFLSFSIALIIYKIGYGFDPFIHNATLDLIDKTGAVEPKPFYYLGQYSLIIILHKITFIPIDVLSKFLVPVLASITLPIFLYSFLDKWLENKTANFLTLALILILPFSIFIISTPQNLAFLFLILLILAGLNCSNFAELLVLYLFTLMIFFIHPLAGIPAFFFSLVTTIYHSEKEASKKYLYLLIFLISSLALPLAFYIFNHGQITFSAHSRFAWPRMPYEDGFILNFVYLYIFNIKFIIAFLILLGIHLVHKSKEGCKMFKVCGLVGSSLLVSYFLTKFISFNFLIYYEQGDYLRRILITSVIFFLPFILISLYAILEKILKQSLIVKYLMLVFLLIVITSSLYGSYSRIDAHFNSRGYSTGKFDLEAVNWIEENASEDYIVLANQQVSAGALKEFGFSKYYKNDIYFYPIPTSGPLYDYYLKMVYENANKKTMVEAMDLAGVSEGYFILNKYWWAFPKILEEAKFEADSYKKFGDGDIWVFEFGK